MVWYPRVTPGPDWAFNSVKVAAERGIEVFHNGAVTLWFAL